MLSRKLRGIAFAFAGMFMMKNVLANTGCPVLQATYVLKADPTMTAGFSNANARKDTLLYVHREKSGHTYWFMTDQGSGYTDTYLYPVVAPRDATSAVAQTRGNERLIPMPLYEMDDELQVLSEPVAELAQAPRYLFAPQLGINLRYFSDQFGEDAGTFRSVMPRSLFEFKACRGAAPN